MFQRYFTTNKHFVHFVGFNCNKNLFIAALKIFLIYKSLYSINGYCK